VGALLIGLLLGGKDASMRSVIGLGTGQRNLSAALLVAAGSFSGKPNVLVMVMLVAIFGLIMLGVVAGEMGKRAQTPADGKDAKTPDDQAASAQ
jgi:BASS family bile acid:Na+ symporter